MSQNFNPADAGIPRNSIPRSNHDVGYIRRFTTNFGRLVPVDLRPVNPTENYNFQTEFILRTVPFIGQVFQRYLISLDTFYVPNHLLWKNFDLFLSGGYDGSTEYVHPYLNLSYFFDSANENFYSSFQYLNSLLDYFDIAPFNDKITSEASNADYQHKNLLPFAAYAKIILDHYTNPHLDCGDLIQEYIQKGWILTDDGFLPNSFVSLMNRLHLQDPNSVNITNVNNLTFTPVLRPYDYDYFTSSLPEVAHGPVMTIPLQLVNSGTDSNQFRIPNLATDNNPKNLIVKTTTNSRIVSIYPEGQTNNKLTVNANIFENVATIESLREAERVLEFFESLGLVGWRPEDFNLSQFNAKSADLRLKISRRVHHQTFTVTPGEVFSNNASAIQSSGTQRDVPGVATGTVKGYGSTEKFSCHIPEYGYLLTLCTVYPEPAYSQGCPKHFDMLDRFDYPNPKFANLGLEPIYNSEIYHTGQVGDRNPFGYTTRYADRKCGINRINSEFRGSFKYMTSSRLFNQGTNRQNRPLLNEAFNKIQVNYNDLDRVFNVEYPLLENGPIIIDMKHNIDCNIPFPHFGTPRL